MPVDTTGCIQVIGRVYQKPGVVLTVPMKQFLPKFTAFAPGIVVTSGLRTEDEQAVALLKKLELGDDLHALYAQDDLIDELLAAIEPAGTDRYAALLGTLKAQTKRGRFLSRHMRGDALDFRVTGYTDDELKDLMTRCVAAGVKTLLEKLPPHLHVEKIPYEPVTTNTRTVTGPR